MSKTYEIGQGGLPMYISRITEDGREQPTRQHLQESAEYACNIGKKFAVSEICRTTALFHDMGKFSSEFVEYLMDSYMKKRLGNKLNGKGSVIHSTQGAKFLYESHSSVNDLIAAMAREISAICIANHHGSLMDGMSHCGDTPFRDRLLKENDGLKLSTLATHFGIESLQKHRSLADCEITYQLFEKLIKLSTSD